MDGIAVCAVLFVIVMRTKLLLVTSIVVSSFSLLACGSDGDGDGTATTSGDEPKAGGDKPTSPSGSTDDKNGSPSTTTSPSGNGNTPGNGTPGNGTPGTGTGTPGTGTGTGTPGGGGNTGGGTGTVPESATCVADSLKEVEANDTPETATDLAAATSFCGSIAGADIDHLTFTMPAEAKGFGWKSSWTGKGTPSMTITAKGVTKTVNEAPPFFPGEKYVIKVTPGADPVDYVVAIKITK